MKCKEEWTNDREWQEVRKKLLGRWKTDHDNCLKEIKAYVEPLEFATDGQVCVVLNYLTCTAFRIGMIDSPQIRAFRKEICDDWRRRNKERKEK